MANSEERSAKGGISSGSALFAKTKLFLRERNLIFGNLTCDPSIYIMDHPDLIVCSFMDNSIGVKRVNTYLSLPDNIHMMPATVIKFL